MSADPPPIARAAADRAPRAEGGSATTEATTDAASILERMADAYAAFDPALRYVAVNAAGERSMRRPREALLGRALTDAFPAATGSESERQYRRVVATGVQAHFTEHYVGDGLDNWVEVDAYPTGDAPPHGVAVFWRDITARVGAERALRAANADLATQNAQLQAQRVELELANQQLQQQAAELEATAEALQAQAAELKVTNEALRAAAERLAESEGRLRRVAESGIVGLFFFDLAGGITEANDAFLTLLGYTQADLAAGRVDWRAMTPPEYAATDEAAVAELVATGAHGQLAKEYLANGGRRVPVIVQSALLRDGATRGVCVCVDDSARRHAEARLGRVLAQTPAAIAVLLGPDHVVQSANETFLRLLGRRDYVGRPARESAPELVEQGFLARMDAVYRTATPFTGREAPLVWDRDGDGTLHEGFFDFVYQPIADAAGATEGVLVFAVEVTAQVRARRAVEGLNAELREQVRAAEEARASADVERARAAEANAAKAQFLTTMSHELRTPLNAIAGYAELLALGVRGPVTDAQRADLGRLQRANQHLIGLVNDVLNFARVDAGRAEYHLEAVRLRPLVADLEALVGPQVAAKGLSYDHDGCGPETPDRPYVVWADPEKLRQILLNLLTNAVKFTDAPGRVTLACEDDTVEGVVRVRVSDTGRGIAADQLARVFEPFVQVDRHRTQASQQGVGLGLAISRELARGMGGELTVQSTLGVGSTFTLLVPAAGPAAD